MPPPLSSLSNATGVVRAAFDDPGLDVVEVRPLQGGMVSTVEAWVLSGPPDVAVVKTVCRRDDPGLHHECETLRWHRCHSNLPVPEPYAFYRGSPDHEGTWLFLEKLPGRNLGAARLSASGVRGCEEQLAEHLVDLHRHKRKQYGSAVDGSGSDSWLAQFGPAIESEFRAVRDRLSPSARATVDRLLDDLPAWLPEFGDPTLVHGDIWANNIMIDDRDPDRPAITGFIDGGATYAEVESELAYLLVFNTAGERFFDLYGREHALRPGFERRCRVYWLRTIMLHVRVFGDAYLPRCEQLAEEIGRLAR